MPKCAWCDAFYSTDEELARHMGSKWNHLVERLEWAELALKGALVERDQMRVTLTEAQTAGSRAVRALQYLRDQVSQWRDTSPGYAELTRDLDVAKRLERGEDE